MKRCLTVFLLLAGLALAQESRLVAVDPKLNARDLGGISVAGGRVKKGMVYRSAQLCSPSARDLAQLQGLKLHTLVDLRSPRELTRDPDAPALLGQIPQPLAFRVENGAAGPPGYRFHVVEQKDIIARFFHLLARRENYPILVHCKMGKDRTGIVSALLLELLGARREDIVEDYLLSGQAGAAFTVERPWIQTVFEVVDEGGGIEAYLESCGLRPLDLESIRNLLTDRGSRGPAEPAQTPAQRLPESEKPSGSPLRDTAPATH